MSQSTNNKNTRSALRDALAADIWAMSDAQVRAEAEASGATLEAAVAAVGAVRARAFSKPQTKVVAMEGQRARAIFQRLAARRALPQDLQMVADLRPPTEAETLAAVERLKAEGLLSEDDEG